MLIYVFCSPNLQSLYLPIVSLELIEVKTYLAGEKSMSWRHHDAITHTSTRIEFQEA